MTIEDWIYRHFDDPKQGREDIIVSCPFCQSRVGSADVSGHLYISTSKSMCHCFRCGYSSSWTHLIQDVTGESFREASLELREGRFIPLYKLVRRVQERPSIEMPSSFRTVRQAERNCNALGTKLAKAARSYIKMRVSPYREDWETLLERWGIWLGVEGIGKLVLPVERNWWQERNISDSEARPKYVSAPYPMGDRLYNGSCLDRCHTVYIAEGIISAACIGEDAVALCGKHISSEQMARLGQSDVERYVICLDSDAEQEALEIERKLYRQGKEIWIRRYASGDPASCKEYEDSKYDWKTQVERRLK